jgi:hypothetical protein
MLVNYSLAGFGLIPVQNRFLIGCLDALLLEAGLKLAGKKIK